MQCLKAARAHLGEFALEAELKRHMRASRDLGVTGVHVRFDLTGLHEIHTHVYADSTRRTICSSRPR